MQALAAQTEDEDEPAGEAAVAVDNLWDRFDWLIVIGAVAGTLLVHPIHLILSRPYWLDEAWSRC